MVKRIRLYAALALIACTAVHAQVAPAPAAGDFYATMLRRGIVSFDAGRDVDAVRQLRIAAFGFVDSLDLYQTAQTYLALAYERSGDTDRARESARKVVAGQRQIPRYASLALPAPVRASFDVLANKLLTTAEVAALRTAASGSAVAPQQTRTASPATVPPAQKAPVPAIASPAPPTPATTTPATTTNPSTTRPAATTPTVTTTAPTIPPAQPPPREQPKTVTAEIPFEAAPPAPRPAAPPQQAAPPPAAKPQPAPAVPPPAAAATTTSSRPLPESEIAKRLVAADRALNAARLGEARTIYRDLLATGSLPRPTLLRVAEGLYRARDFAPALQAFRSLGTLSRGEEPYRYYIAVALYETGDYARAKDELRAVLPFIEVTPDVARYQAKIDGAVR